MRSGVRQDARGCSASWQASAAAALRDVGCAVQRRNDVRGGGGGGDGASRPRQERGHSIGV
jgi:hypothetical protein